MSSPFSMTKALPLNAPLEVKVIRPSSWKAHSVPLLSVTPVATEGGQLMFSSIQSDALTEMVSRWHV